MRKFELRKNMVGTAVAPESHPRGEGEPTAYSSGGGGGGIAGDTRSETWSVDVYASDSEQANEQSENDHRLREIAVDPAVDHIR